MRVLVTGGAGYIGSHVVKALGARGDAVLSFDNLSKGRREAVLQGDLIVGDLADTVLLESVLNDFRPDAVMHFAASIEVGESVLDPLKYYQNNAANTISLLSAMERQGIECFIFSSTAAVYGIPEKVPITESQPLRPINPYGRSKAFVEMALQDIAVTGTLRYVSLRYFNAAGADLEARIGELHEPESHLIPLTLQAAAGRRKSIAIFGDDYPTPDGTCVRDYIHVEDLTEAHLLALDHLRQRGASEVFNCGYGHGHSVREIIDAAKQVSGISIPTEIASRRPCDPPVLVADSAKLARVLNWKPRYDDLELIVRTAWAWEKKLHRSMAHH